MGLFRKRIPKWASFFAQYEYDAFVAALDNTIQRTFRLPYEIREDGLLILPENGSGLR